MVKAAGMIVMGAIIAGAGIAVYAERATVVTGLTVFRQANLGWVLAGFGAEVVSMAAFALLQRRLLTAGRTRLTFGSLLTIAYTSNAITMAVLVAGSGLTVAYAQRQFRASGADAARVSMALLVAGVVSTVAFSVIVAVGAVASGNLAATVVGLLTSLLTTAAMACLAVVRPGPPRRRRRPRDSRTLPSAPHRQADETATDRFGDQPRICPAFA